MSEPPDATEEPAIVAETPSLGDPPPISSTLDSDPVETVVPAVEAVATDAPVVAEEMPAVVDAPVVAEEMPAVVDAPVVAVEMPAVVDAPVVAVEMPAVVDAPVVAEETSAVVDAPVADEKAAAAEAPEAELADEPPESDPVQADHSAAPTPTEVKPAPRAQTAPLIEVPGGTLPPMEEHAPLVMQILGGIVTGVTNKEVDLTLDDGRVAVIHRENFDLAGTDPTTVLQVGDGAEGAVLSREDPRDRVVLSRKWLLRDRAWKKANESIADHSTINCRITAASKKGVVVDVMGLRGFVPLNHFQLSSSVPPPETVGQMVELRVLAADRQKDRLLLSRRSALMKEQRKADAEALQSLKVGGTYKGTVNELTAFGAFVTVNGVRGLLHVSEMSWDRVTSPKGLVKPGEEIDVQVIEVKPKKRRVSFSRKALLDDPMAGIEVGSVHTGTVKRLVDYGVFVDIGPAEGMVHLSELAEYRPHHPSEVVLRGDEVQVKVLKVNREKRRLELSVRQALYFPA